MINSIIIYGDKEAITTVPEMHEELIQKNDNWRANCFGIDIRLYCEDVLNEEDLKQLQAKGYDFVGGNLLHEHIGKQFLSEISTWANRLQYKRQRFIKDLGINLSNINHDIISTDPSTKQNNYDFHRLKKTHKNLYKMSVISAARHTDIYDDFNPHATQFIINANVLPNMVIPKIDDLAGELLQDYKYRKSNGLLKTTGGENMDVNPINGSPIIYTDDNWDVIIGHAHPLMQLCKNTTFRQMLFNVNLVPSTLHTEVSDIFQAMALHIGLEVRKLQ